MIVLRENAGIVPFFTVQVGTWAELREAVMSAGTVPTTIEIINNIELPAGAAFNAIVIAAGQEITLTSVPASCISYSGRPARSGMFSWMAH